MNRPLNVLFDFNIFGIILLLSLLIVEMIVLLSEQDQFLIVYLVGK